MLTPFRDRFPNMVNPGKGETPVSGAGKSVLPFQCSLVLRLLVVNAFVSCFERGTNPGIQARHALLRRCDRRGSADHPPFPAPDCGDPAFPATLKSSETTGQRQEKHLVSPQDGRLAPASRTSTSFPSACNGDESGSFVSSTQARRVSGKRDRVLESGIGWTYPPSLPTG